MGCQRWVSLRPGSAGAGEGPHVELGAGFGKGDMAGPPGCQLWDLSGFGEGAAGGSEMQPGGGAGRTPHPSPSLEIGPGGSRVSGGCCGPATCSVYLCVKRYVTTHWFFVLGFMFRLV